MGFISDNYAPEQTSPVMTDKYHFTTAYPYWLEGRADNPAVFYMFGRKEAQNGGYTLAAGLEGVIDIVKRWQEHGFTKTDFDFIRSQRTPSGKQQFPDAFIKYLKRMKFKLKIDAAPEGTVFFPQEPVLRVEGPIAQVKMLESIALGIINGHSAYMTQAARQSDVLSEELENGSPKGEASAQGLRRGPGLGAALESSRSLGAGGYTSSSTGTAAKAFGQVFAGTMDHAWVETHENELGDVPMAELFRLKSEGKKTQLQQALKKDAFRSFAFAYPESGIFLVDTHDPLQGLEHAITVIKELHELKLGAGYGIRFDSGDLLKYSKLALRRFAEEGFIPGLTKEAVQRMGDAKLLTHAKDCSVFCAAADGIDEHIAKEMRADGAFYKSYGIGTAGSHVPPVGLVYKASSVYMDVLDGKPMPEDAEMTPVMKVASNAPVKSSNPGRLNSRRYYNASGTLDHVVIYDEALGLDPNGAAVNLRNFDDKYMSDPALMHKDLLVPVFNAKGDYVYEEPPKKESFPGSGKMVTDLTKLAAFVKSQLDTLSEGVRRVVRPRDEIIGKHLLNAFKNADKAGETSLTLDLEKIKASLPPEVEHVPVYLDQNLFAQRRTYEGKHAAHSSAVQKYEERWQGNGNVPEPGMHITGDFQVTGNQQKKQK